MNFPLIIIITGLVAIVWVALKLRDDPQTRRRDAFRRLDRNGKMALYELAWPRCPVCDEKYPERRDYFCGHCGVVLI